MKFLKPTLLSLSVTMAFGLVGCTITSQSANEAIRSVHEGKIQTQKAVAPPQSTSREVGQERVVAKAKTMIEPGSNALTYVRTVEGIDEYQLENGLKVLFFEDEAQPKTLVNITYRVGSVHENYGETGMAHLLEHMLFKGSTNFPKIDVEFKKRGMATNATTWLDRTNYFEVFDANEDTLKWAIGMEADRMMNATFNEEQLKSEMTVVRNEMERNENSPTRMLLSRMNSLAYLWHNYGNSTIGARSDVENFPFHRLREFYATHYRPDNAVLTVAGRFDKEKTLALIEQTFGTVARPAQPIQPLYTQEPTQDGERVVNLRRTGDIPYIGLSYHIPSGLHPDAAAFSILQEVLGDYTRGRLQKQLVETGFATGASNFSFLLKDSSAFFFIAQGEKDADLAKMEQKLITIAEDFKEHPITAEEVRLAKLKLAKKSEESMRNVTGVGMALSEYIAKGDYRHAFYFRDTIAQTTVEQVQQAAEKYLIRSNRTLGRFIPTAEPVRAEIPKAPDLSSVLKDYKGKAVMAKGEVFDNNVANIKSRLQQFQWPQGTRVNVYPKKIRGEEVIITMSLPSGSADNLTNKAVAIDFVGSLIKLGNEKYSKEQIATKLDELKASVNISTSISGSNIKITTDNTHLNDTLVFVDELLAHPTFPDKELEVIKRSAISNIESQRNDPSSIASESYQKALYDYPVGHPKAYVSIDQQIDLIKQLDSKTLKGLYSSHFNINNGHITVVGDVNPKAVSEHLKQVMSGYANNTEYQYMPRKLKKVQGLKVSSETPDKANAQLYIINPIDMNVKNSDYLALYIANKIFGGDPFTSRIGARIRVKEGYSYSVAAGIQANVKDHQGLFYSVAISAPENMDKVIKAFQEEVEKVKKDGFTREELDTAVKGYLSARTRSWASDHAIANVINTASVDNMDLDFYQQQLVSVQELTLEDINTAFNKYVAPMSFNVFKAGDFTKANAEK